MTVDLETTTRHDVLNAPHLSDEELGAMHRLATLLEDRSWAHLYLHVGRGEVFAPDWARAVARVGELTGSAALLLRLLALGLPVADDDLAEDERQTLRALAAADLADWEGGGWRTRGWIVAPALGGNVIMGIPSTYRRQQEVAALAYLGNDSLLLAKLLGPTAGRRVLDLGAGCGAQGLLAARDAAEAVLTDIDPFSLRVSALNWALNRVAHPVRLGEGDLFSPVAGERFDLIVVLPPYLPTVPSGGISVTAAGGRDGLSFIRPLFVGAGSMLTASGELVAVAQLLCDDDAPLLARELSVIAPELDVQLVLLDRHPLQPYVAELAGRLVQHGGSVGAATLGATYEQSLRAIGVTGVCTAAIRARRVDGHPSATVVGPTGALVGRDVVTLVPEVTLVGAPGEQALATSAGARRPLDPVTAALVGALDGDRTVAESARAAWGNPPGASAVQYAEQAALRLSELLQDGLLVRRDVPR